jgi:hypothetical protein
MGSDVRPRCSNAGTFAREASKDEALRLATGKFAPLHQPELEHEGAGEGAKPVDLPIDQPTRI